MTNKEKKDLVKYLKYGDIIEIARLSGYTVTTVSNFINNRLKNSGCEPYFTAMANKRKAEVEKAVSELK